MKDWYRKIENYFIGMTILIFGSLVMFTISGLIYKQYPSSDFFMIMMMLPMSIYLFGIAFPVLYIWEKRVIKAGGWIR